MQLRVFFKVLLAAVIIIGFRFKHLYLRFLAARKALECSTML